MVKQESIGPGEPPVNVSFDMVFDIDLLKNVQVRQDKDGVYANDMDLVDIEISPHLVDVLLAEG